MKRFTKTLLALVLVFMMIVPLVACNPEETEVTKKDTLVVGTPAMNGLFWTSAWGNSAYDNWIRKLIHGYETVYTTPGGLFALNMTVLKANPMTSLDSEGNKIYEFEIKEGLKWNDGTEITAKDYVFPWLMMASPMWKKSVADGGAGASGNTTGDELVGWKEYSEGTVDSFKGVQLLGDYKFSLTISKDYLPYFYELALVQGFPYPMHVLTASGSSIESNADNGAKLVKGTQEGALEPLALLPDICATSTAGGKVASGNHVAYKFFPMVTCGPYNFRTYSNQTVTLELNDKFLGDPEGNLPKIKYIVQKYINQTTDIDTLLAGGVDMVLGVIEGAKIEAVKASETTTYSEYKRNGYGYAAFACDYGATADVNVRTAIGYMLNRAQFVQNILGGYGGTVDGEYGLAQWMYEENKDALATDLKNHYSYDITKANQLLDASAYKYKEDGTTLWDGEGFRHTAEGVVLEIKHLGTVDNEISELLQTQMNAAAPLVGLKYTLTQVDFDRLLDCYYTARENLQPEDRYNMFNLASTFTAAFDPYNSSHKKFAGMGGGYNPLNLVDDELSDLVESMRLTDPTDKAGYSEKWLAYQIRYNELSPLIPLYSNQYFDCYSTKIEGVLTTPLYDWAMGICRISIAD